MGKIGRICPEAQQNPLEEEQPHSAAGNWHKYEE